MQRRVQVVLTEYTGENTLSMADFWELAPESSGDAARVARGQHDRDVARRLLQAGRVAADELPELVWVWESEHISVPDVPFTTDGVRLFSPRARAVLDASLEPRDDVQWLPATMLDSSGVRHPGWVLHLPTHEDLLDVDATTWGPRRSPIRYVYSRAKLSGHGLTAYSRPAQVVHTQTGSTLEIPSLITSRAVVITRHAAGSLRAAGVTGARLAAAPVI